MIDLGREGANGREVGQLIDFVKYPATEPRMTFLCYSDGEYRGQELPEQILQPQAEVTAPDRLWAETIFDIEVDDGGPWRHGGTPSGLGPSHKARHALDADGAGTNYPACTHVRLVWLVAEIAVDARLPVRMLPSSPGGHLRGLAAWAVCACVPVARSLLQITAAGVPPSSNRRS